MRTVEQMDDCYDRQGNLIAAAVVADGPRLSGLELVPTRNVHRDFAAGNSITATEYTDGVRLCVFGFGTKPRTIDCVGMDTKTAVKWWLDQQ